MTLTESLTPDLSLALIHHPVLNKHGDTIASAVTNLDLHDLARAARTFGVHHVYVVTPLMDQQELVDQLIGHWTHGHGAQYNPTREAALSLLKLESSLDDAVESVRTRTGQTPVLVATAARDTGPTIGFGALRNRVASGTPHLLLFGTAWGLAPECLNRSDCVLEPIRGSGPYNHLSVRAAAAIILDRLMGPERARL